MHSRYVYIAAAAAESLQSCPTLCDPIDGSTPGSAIPGVLQARTLESSLDHLDPLYCGSMYGTTDPWNEIKKIEMC